MTVSRQVGAALAAVATAAVVLATPAAADPPGIVRVGSTSASHSFDKALLASCPAGTVVTGGGGYLTAPAAAHQGLVALDRLEPLDNGSGFISAMREVHPDLNNWQLSTDAICMPTPLGWDVIPVTGPIGTQTVVANCGTKNLIGVGGRINNGGGDMVLDHVVPSADLKSVTVRGTPVAGRSPVNWSVTAFAVCAYVEDLVRITPFVPASSTAHKGVSASCPPGMALYSASAAISPGNGQLFLSVVHEITVHTFSVAADEDDDGYNLNWTLFGYGICGA
jgi:hypothetical protein